MVKVLNDEGTALFTVIYVYIHTGLFSYIFFLSISIHRYAGELNRAVIDFFSERRIERERERENAREKYKEGSSHPLFVSIIQDSSAKQIATIGYTVLIESSLFPV